MADTSLTFDLLTDAMINPTSTHSHETHLCAEKMKAAAEVIDSALAACSSKEERLALVKANPDFLRAGVRYLTEGRDRSTCGSVIGTVTKCTCMPPTQPIRPGEEEPSDIRLQGPNSQHISRGLSNVAVVISTLCECLSLALSELERGRYHPSDPQAPGPRPWPIRADDLLPFGVEASLLGLESWMFWLHEGQSEKRYAVYKLFQAIVRLHDPFANALLDPETQHIMVYSVPFTDLAKALPKSGFPPSPPRTPEEIQRVGRLLEIMVNFYMSLRNASAIRFSVFLREKGVEFAVLLGMASEAMVHFPSAPWATLRADVEKLAGLGRAVAKASTPAGEDIVLASEGVRWSRDDWNQGMMKPLDRDEPRPKWIRPAGEEEMFKDLERMRRTGWCANPACPPSSDGLPPRLCTQCDFVRFCSDSCSKEAWKSDPLPHKKLCTIIAAIRQRIGREDWARMWAPGFSPRDFAKVCEKRGVHPTDWDAVHCGFTASSRVRNIHRAMPLLDEERFRAMPGVRDAGIIWRNMYMREQPEILARLSSGSIN